MAKVIIYLHEYEFTALSDLAQREYRAPKAQAALMIRRELEKLGMIPGGQPTLSNQTERMSDIQDKPGSIGG